MGCSYKLQWTTFLSLTIVFLMLSVALFIAGIVEYNRQRIAKNTHEENICEVISSSYYESICRTSGRYGRNAPCFIPVWMVIYSIVEETSINATIQHGRLWTIGDAQNRLDRYQIGMSYTCWTNIIDPSIARWDEPSTFDGMILLICGALAAIVGFVGIYLSCRARKRLKSEDVAIDNREVAW